MSRSRDVSSTPALSEPTSHELLKRARAGDPSALDRLFARYLPQLQRWAHCRVPSWARDGADTADFVQDSVIRTLRNLDSFEPQREGALLGYLRRSLLNRVRDQFRHAARHRAPEELKESTADPGVSPLEFTVGEEERRRYSAALKTLRTADRRAIVACIELGYSYQQLALMLNKPSAEAARLAVRRALVRLGDAMRRA